MTCERGTRLEHTTPSLPTQGREVEVLALSRDTTESDLKQRRELQGSSSHFSAQAPLRAALGGRVLVLDGIERAERNVLPTLNNLLENREMSLEDGTMVVSGPSYDRMLANGASPAELTQQGIFRVSPAFRVIALGTPSPPYPGRPLDPPLRSRFAARTVTPAAGDAATVSAACLERGSSQALAGGVAALTSTLHHLATSPASPLISMGVHLPPCPASGVPHLTEVLARLPADAEPAVVGAAFHRVFPFTLLPEAMVPISRTSGGHKDPLSHRTLLSAAASIFSPGRSSAARRARGSDAAQAQREGDTPSMGAVQGALQRLGWQTPLMHPGADQCVIGDTRSMLVPSTSTYTVRVTPGRDGTGSAVFSSKEGESISMPVPCGSQVDQYDGPASMHLSPALQGTLAALVADHATGRDLCLIAPRGSGKSLLASHFASCLGYTADVFALYADMTARDLVQRRGIDADTGDTVWTDSPLVHAAQQGRAVILDNLQTIPAETLATLQSLCVNRQLDLFDGSRLVPAHVFDALVEAGHIDAEGVPTQSGLCDGGLSGAAGDGVSEALAHIMGAAGVGDASSTAGQHGTAQATQAALSRLPVQRLRRVHPSFRILALATPPAQSAPAGGQAAEQGGVLGAPPLADESDKSSSAVAATGAVPTGKGWLSGDILPMFAFHCLPPASVDDAREMLHATVPSASGEVVDAVLQLAQALKAAAVGQFASDPSTAEALTLSLRQLRRLAARIAASPPSSGSSVEASHEVHAIVMSPFLPSAAQAAVQTAIKVAGLGCGVDRAFSSSSSPAGGLSEGELGDAAASAWHLPASHAAVQVGGHALPRQVTPRRPELVPSPVFFDIPRHMEHLGSLARDLTAGERHLLLLGNQGVGKNKLADRLLAAAGWEREYIQVHRDSTVASLTLTPALEAGRITWSDSALVQAVAAGRVLMVDEADKAPTEVLAVLKSLLEDGAMLLPDGRAVRDLHRLGGDGGWAHRPSPEEVQAAFSADGCSTPDWVQAYAGLQHPDSAPTREAAGAGWELLGKAWQATRGILPVHPHFQCWTLANRPGWPFLGNDFFSAAGDLFAAHVVDNPDMASERQLLAAYAPGVPAATLEALASAFADLRSQHESGSLAYPYSTREAVRVARHLDAYPEDGLGQALGDVLAFDAFEPRLQDALVRTFARHGIAVGGSDASVAAEAGGGDDSHAQLSAEWTLQKVTKDGKVTFEWSPTSNNPPELSSPKHGEEDDEEHFGGSNYAGGSGGSNTAGLGGRGGPYRLDKGHTVRQVPQELKDQVSKEARAQAKAMAEAALSERLADIGMSRGDHAEYQRLMARVGSQVHALKSVLASAQHAGTERVWLKNQSVGDLDDTRLVDGTAGERAIFKRRAVVEDSTHAGAEQGQPVKLHFVFDVSGSMFRFNGQDGRLFRSLETALMIMEGFRGQEAKYQYCMTGHSGDSADIPLVPYGAPPADEGERLAVLQTMVAHSQFTFPGDHTLEATAGAVASMAQQDAPKGGKYVFVVSDANLRRYGIPVSALAKAATSHPDVRTYSIFIASMGDEAQRTVDGMPPGTAFAALDTEKLPSIFQRIFASHFSAR